jgi:hypothetical protein
MKLIAVVVALACALIGCAGTDPQQDGCVVPAGTVTYRFSFTGELAAIVDYERSFTDGTLVPWRPDLFRVEQTLSLSACSVTAREVVLDPSEWADYDPDLYAEYRFAFDRGSWTAGTAEIIQHRSSGEPSVFTASIVRVK